jgi:DNA-binding NarL/FixJ family response regulator
MRKQHSFATIIIGKSALIREGIAKILREADFRTAASSSCAEDFAPGTLQLQELLFIVVHTGNDFDFVLEQVSFLRNNHPGGRIAIVADHYRLDELVSVFRAGINGYFVDVMTCDVFVKSIDLLMMEETIFPPAFLSSILGSEIDHFAKAAPRNDNNRERAITAEPNITQQCLPGNNQSCNV